MDRDLIKQQLEHALEGTNFDDQGELYKGKVRDNYINEDTITMVTTDRISAFDRVLGTVPFKGQALVELADWWFGGNCRYCCKSYYQTTTSKCLESKKV